jgi:hypothetical protein
MSLFNIIRLVIGIPVTLIAVSLLLVLVADIKQNK